MRKVLNPEKTVAYCAIVLSEMALTNRPHTTLIYSNYINLDFAGVGMPAIQVDGNLTDEQLEEIFGLIDQNLKSSMYRFVKVLNSYRKRTSKCLNSKRLEEQDRPWLKDPLNEGVDYKFSPRMIAETRLHKWHRKASDKSVPGIVGKTYTEYLQSVYERLQCEAVYEV